MQFRLGVASIWKNRFFKIKKIHEPEPGSVILLKCSFNIFEVIPFTKMLCGSLMNYSDIYEDNENWTDRQTDGQRQRDNLQIQR